MAAKIPADVEQLAKSKGIELVEKTSAVSKGKCTDCKSPLLEGTGVWYEEQIMYFEEPMIKYWIVWSKELRPAAYSWPMGERKYRCHKCFNDFNDARTKMTATREQATKAASKMGIKLFTVFPGPGETSLQKVFCPTDEQGLVLKWRHIEKQQAGLRLLGCHGWLFGASCIQSRRRNRGVRVP